MAVNSFIQHLSEGIYDPGIFKAFFLAGGPGSGKSFVTTSAFAGTGLKVVNSDTTFERNLKKANLSLNMPDEEEYFRNIIRGRAKQTAIAQLDKYVQGRLGLIIDSTGRDYDVIARNHNMLQQLGYDCYMVFVNTSLEVALERNAARERVIPDDIVKESWKECQDNLGKFQSLFVGNFRVIDNTVYKPVTKSIQKAANAFVRKPIYNRIGVKWIENARALKKSGYIRK